MNIFMSLFILLVPTEWTLGFSEELVGIVDGNNAGKEEFPFLVSLQKTQKHRHYCGGSIIHERFVLTAAHCVTDTMFRENSPIRLVAGVRNLTKATSDGHVRTITKASVIRHPHYQKSRPKENDIALIKVDPPFDFCRAKIKKVELAPKTYDIPIGQTVNIVGWGLEKARNRSPPKKLQKTHVKVHDRQKCTDRYRNKLAPVEDTVFCTENGNFMPKDKGVCEGDSGGPTLVNKTMIVGVIKGGYQGTVADPIQQCGKKEYPDFHTEVAKYRDWIDLTLDNAQKKK